MSDRNRLQEARRIVVKLGTSNCLSPSGKPNGEVLIPLARQMVELRKRGMQMLLVSSGAVGLGKTIVQLPSTSIAGKQALAAIGQVELMNVYRQIFELMEVPVAQVLLTREDLDARERYLNARNTLLTLLRAGVLPVINENDSVATEEIKLGDNDILAALVGALIDADLVINLTQAPGLLAPTDADEWKVVPIVREVTDDLYRLVQNTLAPGGTGGMASKLDAARAAAGYGAMMVIARAREPEILHRLLAGEPLGTLFLPLNQKLSSRKRWLATGAVCRGALVVDEGAAHALIAGGRSLLPVGISQVVGEFKVGDIVAIQAESGHELGRGLTNYDADDVHRIKGHPTGRIEELLGFRGYEEVIHRDNLFIKKTPEAS